MPGRKHQIVFARMKKEDIQLLDSICEARREYLSNFVRRAIFREMGRLGFLSEKEMKALGMGKGEG